MPAPKQITPGINQDLRREFFETLSRSRKFLVSTSIGLVIMLVVVGQELREYDRKQKDLSNQIESAARLRVELDNQLAKKCEDIRHADVRLGSSSIPNSTPAIAVAKISRDSLPPSITDRSESLSFRKGRYSRESLPLNDSPRARLAPPVTAQHEFDRIRKELTDGCKGKTRDEIATGQDQWMIPKGVGSGHNGTTLESLDSDQQRLGQGIAGIRVALDKINEDESKKLTKSQQQNTPAGDDPREQLVNLLIEHQQLFIREVYRQREVSTYVKESHELNASKKSIPTPLGKFDIAPKLALLGLSYGTLLAYFYFFGLVRKLRRLADENNAAALAGTKVEIPAPFWSPKQNHLSDRYSSTPVSPIIASLLVHVLWLALAAWLTLQCVVRWNATKALAFDYREFWDYLLIVAFATAVLLTLSLFVESSFKKRFWAARLKTQTSRGVSRRHVLRLGGIGLIGVLAFGLLNFLRRQKRIKQPHLQVSDLTADNSVGNWIENKRSKIIHFQPDEESGVFVCGGHVPSDINRLKTLSPDAKGVHAGCEARILAALANLANEQMIKRLRFGPRTNGWVELSDEERKQGELAIHYLQKAIERSPFTLHWYDQLRKIYGTLGQYDQIKPLLEGGRARVQQEIARPNQDGNEVRRKRRISYLRTIEKAFSDRIQTTEDKRKKADAWKEEQRKKAEKSTPKPSG